MNFTTFFSDLSRKVFKDSPTGDELADGMNYLIFSKKYNTVRNKMMEYKKDLDKNQVDIPEFCKPENERFETFVDARMREIVNGNLLDYFYNLSVNE